MIYYILQLTETLTIKGIQRSLIARLIKMFDEILVQFYNI